LECAKRLANSHCRVTLVDKNNHHLFQPLLYQVATAGLSQPEIAKPIRGTIDVTPDLQVLMDEVTGLDLENQQVQMRSHELTYDYLVIALGAITGYFGNDHWAEHTIGLKSLEEATEIRRKVLYAYEQAEMCDDPGEQKRLMTTVVVGGGPTGVEMAGALIELGRHVLKKDFQNIDPAECHVILIEAMDKVLGTFPDPLPDKALNDLKEMGVDVRLNSPVRDVQSGEVHLDDEVIRAETIIWAAGVQAPKLTRQLNVPLDRGGRINVEPDCSLQGHKNVFAIGDIVSSGSTVVESQQTAGNSDAGRDVKTTIDQGNSTACGLEVGITDLLSCIGYIAVVKPTASGAASASDASGKDGAASSAEIVRPSTSQCARGSPAPAAGWSVISSATFS